MSDVAQAGRTVLFVSHNMSAVLRLTDEALVLDRGRIVMRGPTSEAVDYYMSSGYSQVGERVWTPEEVPAEAAPFCPIALRVCDRGGRVLDTVRSVDPISFEVEYSLSVPVTGLRVGIYLMTARGEYVFTTFDTDDPGLFERYGARQPGRYTSRFSLPPDFLNEGRYVLGLSASSYRVRRYFLDEQALAFTVDPAGAPGMQWAEVRPGPVRPRIQWSIEKTA
jgi:lipopolysaccharide transport system ATP-binding protein